MNKITKTLMSLNIILTIILMPSCVKQSSLSKNHTKKVAIDLKPFEKQLLAQEQLIDTSQELKTIDKKKKKTKKAINNELDFIVENTTGKTIYVTCFSYIKKRKLNRWRWDKSQVYKIENNKQIKIDIDTIPDEQDKKDIYGYLGVFDNYKEAKESIYELLDDNQKINLDLLYKLKNQKIQITIEKYGFKGEILDFDIIPINGSDVKQAELDFVIENKTGKTLLATCFVYQLKDDSHIWKYDKTPVIKILPNNIGIINVDSISASYERVYMRGYLAIFDESEKNTIEQMTYELLKSKNKISLGRIATLKNKKIVLEIEQYGVIGDFIDYSIQPIRRINFKRAFK